MPSSRTLDFNTHVNQKKKKCNKIRLSLNFRNSLLTIYIYLPSIRPYPAYRDSLYD